MKLPQLALPVLAIKSKLDVLGPGHSRNCFQLPVWLIILLLSTLLLIGFLALAVAAAAAVACAPRAAACAAASADPAAPSCGAAACCDAAALADAATDYTGTVAVTYATLHK